jgi:large subunit ribosomal protein L21
MTQIAVIKAGGKQYLVSPDQKIKIEKVDKKEGSEISFSDILFPEGKKKVTAKVLRHAKAKKVIIFKYKAKKRYKVKKGHRQPFTEIVIVNIQDK